MNKITADVVKKTNGKPTPEEKAILTVVTPVKNPDVNVPELQKKTDQPKPEEAVVPFTPIPEAKKEMTLLEKIMKVENLSLVIEKRAKLVQTRSELEKFQISSNDFNCSLRLNDSDGNVFTTSFTPGIKKTIDFLKTSFDASINDVENKINF